MISTHVLDISRGAPAAGVDVTLERVDATSETVGRGRTDANGRIADLGTPGEGVYRLRFDTGAYFAASNRDTLYPEVAVTFKVTNADPKFHLPLLLGPFGYTTYRGS